MQIKSRDNGFLHPITSEITPQAVYEGRRDLMKLLATGAAGAAMAGWASREALAQTEKPGKLAACPAPSLRWRAPRRWRR
jgi:sulfoxide reductase catalytic subunit YedY